MKAGPRAGDLATVQMVTNEAPNRNCRVLFEDGTRDRLKEADVEVTRGPLPKNRASARFSKKYHGDYSGGTFAVILMTHSTCHHVARKLGSIDLDTSV